MTKEVFKARVSMAYHGFYPDREEWERFLEDMWQLHLQAAPHWISVEDYATDELPPLIDEKDPNGESVQVLFVLVLDGVQYLNKGTFDYDSGVWHSLDMQCSFCKENVSHWMPLPTLPKKGE